MGPLFNHEIHGNTQKVKSWSYFKVDSIKRAYLLRMQYGDSSISTLTLTPIADASTNSERS